ncbi:ATP-binding protein [Puniceibacterium sp. IMCC21224]|uniref:hybrid sensor histidine kinase/response regulator n=1 Tax=Puniceibacterium sp. IMCC21224 TaxID=1618204 RepID=UPI00064DFCBE|nr:ATP-binding protein [Puniceibacterium sp. IMCC21224]KMK67253.1 PAS domain S-box [Puniceibacterium sp. IMCC21224]
MSDAILLPGTVLRASRSLRRRTGLVFALGILCLLVAFFAPQPPVQVGLIAGGAAFVTMALVAHLLTMFETWSHGRLFRVISAFVERDLASCMITDQEGAVLHTNGAARKRFTIADGTTVAAVLRPVFANPVGLLYRLRSAAESDAVASEDVAIRGGLVRITARIMAENCLLWRIEFFEDSTADSRSGHGPTVPVLTLGRNGVVLSVNEAARALTGKRPKRLEEVIADLPVKAGRPNEVLTLEGPVLFLTSLVETGPGRQELVLLPIPDDSHDRDRSAGFDTLPVPLLKVASDGTVLRANREAQKMLNAEVVDGHMLSEFMEGLGRSIKDWLGDAAAGRGLNRSEFLRLSRADREVFVQVTLNRVMEGGLPVLVAVLNDATELKTLEAQFVQSQKMQAIGQLAGGIAHDFNNLLTAISGHCDLLLLRHDQGDLDFGDLVQINQNANRAAALVGQLLAFSRKQTLRPEILDLRDTLSDLTHLLNRLVGEKVSLTLRHDPVLPPIRGDKRQLEQVMMNLVVNARDAMKGGGTIVIETSRCVLKDPLLRDRAVVAPGSYVSVKVTDEGTGIPQDKLQKVFEPFFTTKRTGEGTGLGLSTVYGIVKQTGGFIFVDSVVGAGSCFTLLFPSHDAPARVPVSQPIEMPQRQGNQGTGVVLLVEDEAPVRAFASRALRLRGYTVVEAESAEDALTTLQDQSLSVDVFVTDVVMPGMDGPTWVRQALVDRPDVRVVFVSGYAEDVFGDDKETIPNSVFLPKPFSLNELAETVYNQLC